MERKKTFLFRKNYMRRKKTVTEFFSVICVSRLHSYLVTHHYNPMSAQCVNATFDLICEVLRCMEVSDGNLRSIGDILDKFRPEFISQANLSKKGRSKQLKMAKFEIRMFLVDCDDTATPKFQTVFLRLFKVLGNQLVRFENDSKSHEQKRDLLADLFTTPMREIFPTSSQIGNKDVSYPIVNVLNILYDNLSKSKSKATKHRRKRLYGNPRFLGISKEQLDSHLDKILKNSKKTSESYQLQPTTKLINYLIDKEERNRDRHFNEKMKQYFRLLLNEQGSFRDFLRQQEQRIVSKSFKEQEIDSLEKFFLLFEQEK